MNREPAFASQCSNSQQVDKTKSIRQPFTAEDINLEELFKDYIIGKKRRKKLARTSLHRSIGASDERANSQRHGSLPRRFVRLLVGTLWTIPDLGSLSAFFSRLFRGACDRSLAMLGASSMCSVFSIGSVALLAGYVVAVERRQRSAEFLAYLPPSRNKVIFSKAIVCFGWMLIAIVVYVAMVDWFVPWLSNGDFVFTGDQGRLLMQSFFGKS